MSHRTGTFKINAHPAPCRDCGETVARRQGRLVRHQGVRGGKWAPQCEGCWSREIHGGAITRMNSSVVLTPEPQAPETPAPEQTPAPSGTVESALRAFVESVASRAVDPEQVEAIARQVAERVVSEQAGPTRVDITYTRPDTTTAVIEGAHPALEETLFWLGLGENVMLIGPAGSGKTTLAKQAAQALGVPYYPDGSIAFDYRITGHTDGEGQYHTTPFRQAYEHGGLWLGDENDSSSPEVLLALNQALANGMMTFPDSPEPVHRHPDFYAVATANTWGTGADREYVGRSQLDAAYLNRFIRLPVDYSPQVEAQVGAAHPDWVRLVQDLRARARTLGLRHIIGTREIIRGTKALSAGMDRGTVIARVLRSNLSDSDWAKLTEGVTL